MGHEFRGGAVNNDGAGERATIAPSGDLDLGTIPSVRATTDSALSSGIATIVYDLSEVTFLDSSALALFAYAAQHAKTVVLRNPSDLARRVIHSTGLSEILVLEP